MGFPMTTPAESSQPNETILMEVPPISNPTCVMMLGATVLPVQFKTVFPPSYDTAKDGHGGESPKCQVISWMPATMIWTPNAVWFMVFRRSLLMPIIGNWRSAKDKSRLLV